LECPVEAQLDGLASGYYCWQEKFRKFENEFDFGVWSASRWRRFFGLNKKHAKNYPFFDLKPCSKAAEACCHNGKNDAKPGTLSLLS